MKFICILAHTARSQAYLQTLVQNKIFPKKVIILDDQNKKRLGKFNNLEYTKLNKIYKFKAALINPQETLVETLNKNNINYDTVMSADINSDQLFSILSKLNIKLTLVSVYAGQILKEKILNLNKYYLHIHGGVLPEYRGSTTMYYSLLTSNTLGASAIFINQGIDTGDIVYSKGYQANFNLELLDLIYDPLIRADVLINALKELSSNHNNIKQQSSLGEDYFVIHPVLKHIAILGGNEC